MRRPAPNTKEKCYKAEDVRLVFQDSGDSSTETIRVGFRAQGDRW